MGTANYVFDYTGPLNFVNNNGSGDPNTFAEFFGTNVSGISGLTSTQLSSLLGTTMSTPGFKDNTYMSFTGNYTGGGSVGVYHDDGASLYYMSDGAWISVLSNPTGWQTTDFGTLPMGTSAPFDLVYVESNGAPSDLIVTGLSPVPEPGTIGLMALGMIGLGALMYRGSAFNS